MATLSAYLSTYKIPNDWYSAGFGGVLIGSSAVCYLIMHGRVCGISGILGRVLDHSLSFGANKNQQASLIQFGFLFGLLLSALIWLSPTQNDTNPILMLISGLLVGFGTRFGNGCTSGHGICGLARRSIRSIVAVTSFLLNAIIASTISSIYFSELYSNSENDQEIGSETPLVPYLLKWTIIISIFIYLIFKNIDLNVSKLIETLSSIIIGLLFGKGLILSGMVKPEKVRNFLNISPENFIYHWDPSLMFVLCFGLLVSVSMYPFVLWYLRKPILDLTGFHMPTNTIIDNRLLIGSSIFGIGWGLVGVCPGPGILVMISTQNMFDSFWMWCIGLIIGMKIFHPILKIYKNA